MIPPPRCPKGTRKACEPKPASLHNPDYVFMLASPKRQERGRCPNGTRRVCRKNTTSTPFSPSHPPRSMVQPKPKRISRQQRYVTGIYPKCKRGYRRSKETGNCEPLSITLLQHQQQPVKNQQQPNNKNLQQQQMMPIVPQQPILPLHQQLLQPNVDPKKTYQISIRRYRSNTRSHISMIDISEEMIYEFESKIAQQLMIPKQNVNLLYDLSNPNYGYIIDPHMPEMAYTKEQLLMIIGKRSMTMNIFTLNGKSYVVTIRPLVG